MFMTEVKLKRNLHTIRKIHKAFAKWYGMLKMLTKICQSCRIWSRNCWNISLNRLIAKFNVDTAENGPSKVWVAFSQLLLIPPLGQLNSCVDAPLSAPGKSPLVRPSPVPKGSHKTLNSAKHMLPELIAEPLSAQLAMPTLLSATVKVYGWPAAQPRVTLLVSWKWLLVIICKHDTSCFSELGPWNSTRSRRAIKCTPGQK